MCVFSLIMGLFFRIRGVVTRVLLVQSIEMYGLLTLSVLSRELASAWRVLFVDVGTLTA